MNRQSTPTLRAAALLLLAFALCAGGQTQECSWAGVERIVAVGDLHGDFDRLAEILRDAAVVNASNAWTGGRTHLVQMGDVLDRGPDSRRAMDLLRRLEKEAESAGGRVHCLVGNHEAMLSQGITAYVHPGESESFGGESQLLRALGPEGEYGRWIRTHNAAVRINDTLFVHGGISPRFARRPLREINEAIRGELARGSAGERGALMAEDGPLWYRGLALDDEPEVCAAATNVLAAFRVSRIVLGHTASRGGIRQRCGGRIVAIDAGLSRHYIGGPAEYLVIEGGKVSVRRAGGPDRRGQFRRRPVSSARAGRSAGARAWTDNGGAHPEGAKRLVGR